MKDQTKAERNSASSMRKLLFDNRNDIITNEQQLNRRQTSKLSLSQNPANRSIFREPSNTITASTVIWYVCICILFAIAFLALVLSVLYFLNDSSTEQVIKLYGITGSGCLAIVTFIIIFFDCYNDGDREYDEEEAIYRILQIKETRDNELAMRHTRRITEKKEEKPKPLTMQHQRPRKVSIEPYPHPYYYDPYPYSHHIHPYSPTFYPYPIVCPICHDSHAPINTRRNLTDIGVDTSDKFEPVSKSKNPIPKSIRDAQTEPQPWDAEHGTQTDRTEGTQTSAMELSGMPNNVVEIIHETTILKAPPNLIPTLKKSMEQQDKKIAFHRAVTDTNSMTVARTNSRTVARTNSRTVARTNSRTVARTNSMTVGDKNSMTVADTNSVTVASTNSMTVGDKNSMPVADTNSVTVAGTNSMTVGDKNSTPVADTNPVTVAGTNSMTVGDKNSTTVADTNSMTVADV